MERNIKVSIIIPVYNTGKYISRCLDSIFAQTLQDFEIIIVNDQSPDNAMQIVKKYAEQEERIRIFENLQNMGLMWTRREGYRRAVGEYVVFCDSDDFFPPNALKVLYEAAQINGVDIVISAYTYITVYQKKNILKQQQRILSQEEMFKALLRGEIAHSLWAKIYHRKLFFDYEYDTFEHHTNGEDMILLYQLVQYAHRMAVIEDSTYYYCQNLQSSTQKKLSDKQLGIIVNSINWFYDFMKDKILYRNLFNKKMLNMLYFLLSQDVAKKYLFKLNTEFMQQVNFQFVHRYWSFPKTITFYLMLHSFGLRRIFTLKQSLFFYLRNILSK